MLSHRVTDSSQMKLVVQTAVLIVIGLLAAACEPKNKLSCSAPPGAISVRLLELTLLALRRAVARDIGEVASPFEDFAEGCIAEPGKLRQRLLFVWKVGSRWVVATERGGYAYSNPVLAYELTNEDETASLVEQEDAFPQTVCATAKALIVASGIKRPR